MVESLSGAGPAAGLVCLGHQVSAAVQSILDSTGSSKEPEWESTGWQASKFRDLLDKIQIQSDAMPNSNDPGEEMVKSTVAGCENEVCALNSFLASLGKTQSREMSSILPTERANSKRPMRVFSKAERGALESRLRDVNDSLQSLSVVIQDNSETTTDRDSIDAARFGGEKVTGTMAVTEAEPMPQYQAVSRSQYNNTGHGSQFNGNTFNGPVNFVISEVSQLHMSDITSSSSNTSLRQSVQFEKRYEVRSSSSSTTTKPNTSLIPAACPCKTRRSWSQVMREWGFWIVSKDERAIEYHAPGCRFAKSRDSDRRWEVGLRFTGLRYLSKGDLGFYLAIINDADARRISPSISYFPVVNEKTAPAFVILELSTQALFSGVYDAERCVDIMECCMAALTSLYAGGGALNKVSPKDTDSEGGTTMHALILFIVEACWLFSMSTFGESTSRFVQLAQEAVHLLVAYGVPAMRHDHHGRSPMSELIQAMPSVGGVEMVTTLHRLDPESPIILDRNFYQTRILGDLPGQIWELNRLYHMPGVIESSGCGPLGVAIVTGDEQKIIALLKRDPSCIHETNDFKQNVLHLSAGNPPILELVISLSQNPPLNTCDRDGSTPLRYSLKLESPSSIEILATAGCRIPLSSIQHIRDKTAASVLVRALAERRNRLKDLGLQHLPKVEASEMGLQEDKTLDFNSRRVQARLESLGIEIPSELAVGDGEEGVYNMRRVLDPSLCPLDILWDHGFQDIDEQNTLLTTIWGQSQFYDETHWFIQHGADVSKPFRDRQNLEMVYTAHNSSLAHFIMATIGSDLSKRRLDAGFDSESDFDTTIDNIRSVVEVCLPIYQEDYCFCVCSNGGCTPFSVLLKWLCWSAPYQQDITEVITDDLGDVSALIVWFIEELKPSLTDSDHRILIRVVTFQALQIKHTCCLFRNPHENVSEGFSEEGAREINSEQADLLQEYEDLVDKLVEVFKKELDGEPLGVADPARFWNEHWLPRVTEVLARYDESEPSELDEDGIRGIEEIGVVWYGPERESESSTKDPFQEYRERVAAILNNK